MLFFQRERFLSRLLDLCQELERQGYELVILFGSLSFIASVIGLLFARGWLYPATLVWSLWTIAWIISGARIYSRHSHWDGGIWRDCQRWVVLALYCGSPLGFLVSAIYALFYWVCLGVTTARLAWQDRRSPLRIEISLTRQSLRELERIILQNRRYRAGMNEGPVYKQGWEAMERLNALRGMSASQAEEALSRRREARRRSLEERREAVKREMEIIQTLTETAETQETHSV